ncbi:type IV toxin-antitoxin system AbiEi family antitoxin [Nocardia sp. XZ_19_369]|uniref:type IV toxin-antitoxin system AbiEi family antitoxin n=1 Tax=Nocardia sp. XZ_19_369 TaxID=2769487 RepID=UPI00188E1FC5|nr:type IV toxin-antitoxin system AbiEi family antitoxin [Nocardia sp. XZ_19_369]
MADRTLHCDIEHSVARALSEFSIEFSVLHWTADQTAIVSVSRRNFDMTYRMAWLSHATLSGLSRLDQQDSAQRLLVTSPHINSRTAEALRAAHIDYIDYAGNTNLNFGPVLVDVRGRRNPNMEQSHRPADANLFSARRMQVLFVLLAWPDFADMPVRRIAEAAGTSVGITQSTLEIMKESDYLVGKRLHRREELLDLWTAAFRGTLLPKIRRNSFKGDIENWSTRLGALVSGESAVELIRKPQTLTIYTKKFDLMDAVSHGWQQSTDPNIEIRHQFWNEPPWAVPSERRDVFARSSAPPLLIYADLLAVKEPRQAEVARTLRREQLV